MAQNITVKNDAKKQEALESVERIVRQRKFSAVAVPLAFFFARIISRSFPQYTSLSNLIWIFMTLIVALIFPLAYFIRRNKKSLSASSIYLILAADFVVELISLLLIFYLIAPMMIYYFGSVILIVASALILYNILSNPIFNSRKYSVLFFLLSLFFLVIFALVEYFNFYPSYDGFPIETRELRVIIASFSAGVFLLFLIQSYIDNFWQMFRKQAQELEILNEKLEQRVRERTSELEEAKMVLEIKVRARTNELEELTRSLEKKVQERTRELQYRVDELERFHKLAVGRELRMMELKEELKKSKQKKEK